MSDYFLTDTYWPKVNEYWPGADGNDYWPQAGLVVVIPPAPPGSFSGGGRTDYELRVLPDVAAEFLKERELIAYDNEIVIVYAN